MSLVEYRKKRNFRRTKEPRGGGRISRHQPVFAVQKHAASRLHYDFRLELDGVLKSWAVPKGPDMDPQFKRLAMQVEDHPVEYGNFEGIIPAGEYGGGTVMLWDRGTWEPLDDAKKSYREGRLKFVLHGQKLKGAWMLVRKGGKSSPDERHWFLFKERDKFAGGNTPITEREPLSVATGRDMDEIAQQADRVWGPVGEQRSKKRRPQTAKVAARKESRPEKRVHSINADGSAVIAGVRISHPDKVLYPEQSLTKSDLATYYERVAEWMLPHVENRPLAIVRCPGGRGKPCFFQKHPSEGGAKHLAPVDVSESSTPDFNQVIKDVKGLVELVQMGVLEIHVWGSQAKNLEKPDRLIFDLDPDPSVSWPAVVTAAQEIRLFLEELGLVTFLKTTGGKGLHLVAPIQARTEWDEAKAFCKAVADLIVRAAPDQFIATMSKAARKGKIFIDYLRNGRGSTAIAPYSTRAKPGAPVSVPIAWSELSPNLKSDQFTVENLFERLDKLKKDPWADLATIRQSITKSMLRTLEAQQ
jgi:bifunctional non-homologous end joining protein LigD